MELKKFILILLVCIILYLIYNIKGDLEEVSKKTPTMETFQTSIIDTIDELYEYDIDTMRNFAQITKTILNDDNFILPAATTRVNNIIIDENINFSQLDTLMYLLPRYSVIGWYNTKSSIPSGWAVCDGQRYILDNNGNAKINSLGTLTPDLRGRFILGAGIGKDNNKDMTERKWQDMGGEETHLLTLEELSSHYHKMYYGFYTNTINYFNLSFSDKKYRHIFPIIISNGEKIDTPFFQSELNKLPNQSNTFEIYKKGGILREGTGTTGLDLPWKGDWTKRDIRVGNTNNPGIYDVLPHENMPPFYVIIYIMKL